MYTKNGKTISEQMYVSRVNGHQRVTDLTSGFDLGGTPFSIQIIPVANLNAGVVSYPNDYGLAISCSLIHDTNNEILCVPFLDWTPATIVSLAPTNLDLVNQYILIIGKAAN